MIFPISKSVTSFKKFADEIYDMLSQINLNELVPHEFDLRLRIAKLILEAIESSSRDYEIILNLERQSIEKYVKIDMVLYYISKDESDFAEIIELKRGIDDELSECTHSNSFLKNYLYTNAKTKFAIDMKKIIERVSTREVIGRGYSNNKETGSPDVEIRTGFFINLCPNKKSGKDGGPRLPRRTAIRIGVDFWNSELGKAIIKDKDAIRGDEVILTYRPYSNLQAEDQETPEYLDIIMVKRKS